MNRNFWLSVLAVLPILSVVANGQAAPVKGASAVGEAPNYKYEAYVAFGYTSLNQVNLSRHGLIGERFGLMRDWGKYFGLGGVADYYRYATGSGNPGDPSVYSFAVVPEVHGYNLIGPVGAVLFGELGGEHTGGEGVTPLVSFAGGFGGGAVYSLNKHIDLRATGDRFAGSFSLSNNTPSLAYSTHKTWNPRAAFGVVYKF